MKRITSAFLSASALIVILAAVHFAVFEHSSGNTAGKARSEEQVSTQSDMAPIQPEEETLLKSIDLGDSRADLLPRHEEKETDSAVMTKEDAINTVLAKFSVSELNSVDEMTRDGISPEEFRYIADTLLSRLSPDEYRALETVVLLELQKNRLSLSDLEKYIMAAEKGISPEEVCRIKAAISFQDLKSAHVYGIKSFSSEQQ